MPSTTPNSAETPRALLTDGMSELARLQAENAELHAQVATLEARIADLERRLNSNSQNSNQPPSSDGLKRPKRTKSLRRKSRRRTGGQPGHPGHTREASPAPDKIVHQHPELCGGCGAALAPDPASPYQARQVHDLRPPPKPEVTEHRAHTQQCPVCKVETTAAFPPGVSAPVQYGPEMSACVVYLRNHHFMPEARLAQIMKDL